MSLEETPAFPPGDESMNGDPNKFLKEELVLGADRLMKLLVDSVNIVTA